MHFLTIDIIINNLSIWGNLCCSYLGRSNIVTGVAKTIMAHFKKHPLAIVNVKGRAKGTSVQEVVFLLEVCKPKIFIFIFFIVRLNRLAESFPPSLSPSLPLHSKQLVQFSSLRSLAKSYFIEVGEQEINLGILKRRMLGLLGKRVQLS